MAGTRSAGRVSIRVLPDSTGFRQDVKKMLDRLERQLRVQVPVELVVDRATLAKLKREIESLVIKLKPQIDLSVDQGEITKLKERIERIKPKVDVELNTRAAATAMAVLSRTREALIRVRLDRGALASVSTRLAALAGGNVLLDTINEGREFLDNIDRQAVSLGKLALMMGTVANAAGSMLGGLVTAGAQLNDVVGFLAAAPAFGIGAAIQIASLVAIFKDWGTEMEFLNPYLSELQDILSFTYFRELRPAMRDLVENLFPALRDTLDRLGTEQGIFAAKMARAVQEFVTPEKFTTMMNRMIAGIKESEGAIRPFTEALTILGMVGSEYFERFGKAITNAAESFRDFIAEADERGDINRWIEDAIQLTKDLTSFTINLTRVMGTLATATEAAGFGNIGDWSDSLDKAADVMARPEFQRPLVTFLKGFREGLNETMRGITELGPALSSIAPTMREVFRGIGTSVRVMLGYVSQVMENPFFQKGLTDFIDGVERGLRNLGPAVDPLATGLGGVLTLLGTVAGELGNLLTTFTVEFQPALDTIGRELDSLVEPLSVALQNIITNLAPPFTYFAEQVVPPLVDLFKEEFLPILEDISEYVSATLQPVLEEFKQFIEGDLRTAVEGLGDWLEEGDPKEFGNAVRDFMDDVETFLAKSRGQDGGLIEGDWFNLGGTNNDGNNLAKDAGDLNQGFAAALREAFDRYVVPAWNDIIAENKKKAEEFAADPEAEPPGNWLVEWIANLFKDDDQPLSEAIAEDWDEIVKALDDGSVSATNAINSFFEDQTAKTQEDWDKFLAGFEGMGEDLRLWAEGLFDPLTEYWDTFFDELFGAEGGANVKMLGFPALAATALAGLTETITVGLPALQVAWDVFWANFGTTLTTVWEGFKLTVSTKMTEIGLGLATAGIIVQENWNLFWTGLGLTLATKWEEFKLTASTKYTELGVGLATKGVEIQTGWNTTWTGVGLFLATKWEEMKTTVSTKATELGVTVATKSLEAKNSLSTNWEAAKQITATKWEEIRTQVRDKLAGTILDAIAKIGEIRTTLSNGWINLKTDAQFAWAALRLAIEMKGQEIVDWVTGLPDKIRNALDVDLSGSGSSIIQSFINGMAFKLADAIQTARNIIQNIRNEFPSSPAKSGPFSGSGWTSLGNGSVVDQFADGMAAKINKVRKVSRDIANAAAIDPEVLDTNFDQALEGGGPGDHKSTVINNYNPVAEPTSRSIEKAASLTRMKGGL